ncbi:MAG: hypothetical protein Q7T55_21745, partial [Solirubrobacteraceae bacterium]|nr:hypothetical protein [Solirubrobacteraceae bacterium]
MNFVYTQLTSLAAPVYRFDSISAPNGGVYLQYVTLATGSLIINNITTSATGALILNMLTATAGSISVTNSNIGTTLTLSSVLAQGTGGWITVQDVSLQTLSWNTVRSPRMTVNRVSPPQGFSVETLEGNLTLTNCNFGQGISLTSANFANANLILDNVTTEQSTSIGLYLSYTTFTNSQFNVTNSVIGVNTRAQSTYVIALYMNHGSAVSTAAYFANNVIYARNRAPDVSGSNNAYAFLLSAPWRTGSSLTLFNNSIKGIVDSPALDYSPGYAVYINNFQSDSYLSLPDNEWANTFGDLYLSVQRYPFDLAFNNFYRPDVGLVILSSSSDFGRNITITNSTFRKIDISAITVANLTIQNVALVRVLLLDGYTAYNSVLDNINVATKASVCESHYCYIGGNARATNITAYSTSALAVTFAYTQLTSLAAPIYRFDSISAP